MLHQEYLDDGLRVVGAWGDWDTPEGIADFRTRTGVTFPLVLDPEDTIFDFEYARAFSPYPRDVLIGKDLTIKAIRSDFDPLEWQRLVEEALAE